MALDTILLGLFAFMLGGGSFGGKKTAPATPPRGGGPAPSTPSKVPWPSTPSSTVLPTGTDAVQVALAEKDLIVEKEKLKRDAAEARERAKGDPAALADIARKEKERQEALAAMQQDIERAKGKA